MKQTKDKKVFKESVKLINYIIANWKGDKELYFENVDITEDNKRVIIKGCSSHE